jgi:hypothetical protein
MEESHHEDDGVVEQEEPYEPEELQEPDYETASIDQLIDWCQYLKYKFEMYINQMNDREALVSQQSLARN